MMSNIADLPPLHKMTEDLWYHALKFLDKYRYNACLHDTSPHIVGHSKHQSRKNMIERFEDLGADFHKETNTWPYVTARPVRVHYRGRLMVFLH